MIIGDGSYCFTLEKRGYVKVSGKSLNTYDSIILTQTFTYYSRVGTPDGCDLTVSICFGINEGFYYRHELFSVFRNKQGVL